MDVIAELEDGQTLNLTPEWLIEWEKEQEGLTTTAYGGNIDENNEVKIE